MATLPTQDTVPEAAPQRRLSAFLVSWAVALMFALFAHVATCDPCYEDDVCASARTDYTLLQKSNVQTLDVGDPADGGNTNILVQLVPEPAVLFHSASLSQMAGLQLENVSRENLVRNSSLAHRQTVVLVI